MLLVEDSEEDALLLLRELERGGYEPVCERVEVSEDMRKALAGSDWDVVLSDHRLPRFGSSEALELARRAGSRAPFILVSGRIGEEAAIEAIKAGAYDYVMKDELARLCTTVERGLKEAEERRERQRAEEELHRRDAVLEAVRFASERLLGETAGWEESVKAVLRRLGEATGVSRVYVYENYVREDGELRATYRYEWSAPGVSAHIDDPAQKEIRYRAAGYGRWVEMLGRGEPIHGHTRELPEKERPVLREMDILSIAVVPVFVGGNWWGVIGFDECEREREWSVAEVGALGAAAGTLGAAIRRRQVDEELRTSEAELRAVFGAMNDVILVLDSEGRYLKVAPTTFSWLYRPPEELVGKTVHDTFPQEQADRILASIRRALETRSRVDIEYGLTVGEGEMWFEATITPMLEDSVVAVARDITERRENEEALRQSENRLRTIVQTEPECVKVLGMDGSLMEMNPAGLSMLEADSLEQVRGRPVYEYIAPANRGDFVELTQRVLRGGSGTLEFELVGLKGTSRWLETHAVPLRGAGGEIAGLLAITRNVTERRKNEEALRESEERFRNAFDSAAIGMGLVDLEGRWLRVNQPLCDIVGYPEQELLELTFQDITHPDDLDGDLLQVKRLVRGDIRGYHMEKRYLHKNGHPVWIMLSVSLVRDDQGNPLYFISQIQDITARKQAEEALKQSERLYRAVMEQATENIFLVDAETRRVVESNPAFREALGYPEEELRDMTLYDIVAADRESIDANIRRVLEQRIFVGQRKYRRKDGSSLDVEVSASTILRDGRETLCVVAHDVTERARAQRLLEERVATLSRVAADLVLERPLEDSLDILAKSVLTASTAVACAVSLIDEATGFLRIEGSHGLPEGFEASIEAVWRNGSASSTTLEALHTRRPTLADYHRQRMLDDPHYAPVHHLVREVAWDTVFVVPLVSRDRTLGAIQFSYLEGQQPGEDERVFLEAVADQAAVAVENLRLFAEARGKAALEERQKLARELHDSVSQALYGIALGTKTAREEFDDNPAGVPELLDYVFSLSEAGQAEMRALIFELRPESLETEGVVAALEKQAAALEARHQIKVKTDLCEEPEAPLEAKETLYRIAQEALHNTAKHASARNVDINMECGLDRVTLDISDDGVGFDAQGDFPGHLGLRSMRERASRLGGTLRVQTAPGKGTRICARIPL